MASNEHSTLDDSQLHVPKGFSTAANNTVLTKNSSGSLQWSNNRSSTLISTGGYHSTSGAVGNQYAKQFSADYHNFNTQVDALDATNGSQNEGMKWAHMYSEFVCHASGTVAGWRVMHGGSASADWDLKLFKLSVTTNTGANVDLTQLGTTLDLTNHASGSKFVTIVDMTLSGTLTFAENDVLIQVITKQTAGSKNIWWNGTLELTFDL
jgi:hypothetical protein|tara:strand:- start:1162 stop:1788 length:627 start_codon:yes stop_codon:yes gene_type:complete